MYGQAMLHFYKKFIVPEDGTVSSKVKGVDLVLDVKMLGVILNVPVEGFDTYVRCERPELWEKEYAMYLTSKYTQEREKVVSRKVWNGEIKSVHKLLFEFVNKCLLPRSERRHEATYLDLEVMEVLDQNMPINLLLLMLKHVERKADQEKGTHALPFGFLLTRVFDQLGSPLRGPKK